MSNIQPSVLQTCLIKDPIVDFPKEMFCVEKSASTSQDFLVTTNNYSTASTSFQINVNSKDAIIDRNIILTQPLTINIQRTPTGAPLVGSIFVGNAYGFRSWPLNKGISSITAQIGNISVTQQTADLMPAFERVYSKVWEKYMDYGTTVTMPDKTKELDSSLNTSSNPLAGYSTVGFETVSPRGGWPALVTSNTTTNGSISATLYEPLFLSPLIASLRERVTGFTHLTSIIITINWAGNLADRIFNCVQGIAGRTSYTQLSNVVFGPPTLTVTQYIDPLIIAPSVSVYSNNIAERYTTDFTLPNNTNIFSVASQTIQLSSIPKLMIVYAMRNWNNFDMSRNNSFVAINGIQVNFNGVSYMNSTPQNILYKYSVQNGVNMSWLDWSGQANGFGISAIVPTVGSVLALSFGNQIPLPSTLAPSTSCKVNLSINVQMYNQDAGSNAPEPYTLYLALVYDGSISLYGSNSGTQNYSCITELDTLQAVKESPEVSYHLKNDHGFGSSMSGGANMLTSGKLLGHIRSVKNIHEKYHPFVKLGTHMTKHHLKSKGRTAGRVADIIHELGGYGYGEGDGEGDGEGEGRHRMHSMHRGMGLSGGKHLSKHHLKKHLL